MSSGRFFVFLLFVCFRPHTWLLMLGKQERLGVVGGGSEVDSTLLLGRDVLG